MPLTCDSHNDDGDAAWYFETPLDYSLMPPLPRRKRCASCRSLIDPGTTVLAFPRWRPPARGVEAGIYGEGGQVSIATLYHCETCADLYLSLTALKFCVAPDESMRELVAEYAATYGPREAV